ncbi:delta-lactam-biosynthetic de-N-acetylase [Halalkalibacillus sediminis]|uniref:Delta-lactam-biosynthetic de-N-acetylase n=1 Tax=Halalkalibacillus sediminis TaxID=2018042 RepID=A0A2I0QRH1_9BACI|nr:delta-lactam-biosynthetic de-N-acetylase [Halalkalibacillus sediminis]PKR76934.1 delta-lactam-biosynthetic de-N-acetylase [Halalkalibacillus sediminis]
MKKNIVLTLIFVLLCSYSASAVSNDSLGYGYKKKFNESPPDLGFYAPLIEKYNGIYMGDPNEKKIYITFDNGYEQGYTSTILDVLKEKKVPATFFLTGHYVDAEVDLVKRMVDEGHLIGNHSDGHLDYTRSSDEKVKEDLRSLDEKVKKTTGQDMSMFFRPAKGVFSERTLKLTDELGYVNVFWTVALVDWYKDQQKGAEHAQNEVLRQVHPGAIVLLHAVSEDNSSALSNLIDELRKRGYEFGSLEELMWERLLPEGI